MAPRLRTRLESVHIVAYHEFETFVMAVYGKEFNFTATVECGNDTSHLFDARKPRLAPEPMEFRNGVIRNGIYLLFDHLVHDGWIPEGKYLINVCW